jgi:branched-chain amino acid transport system ATP-binding protein
MMFDVTGLQAGYRENVTVVRDIGFGIERGATGVVGRNGAGKSCLAQVLSGALRTTSGTIELEGVDVTSLDARERVLQGICLVPEGRLVFGQLTVQENLVVAAYSARTPVGRAQELKELFPVLGRKQGDRAASLSGGEQQLLAIARALVQQPKILILDEPSLGLSPIAIENLSDVLAQIRDELGICMILMEQNSELLTSLCDQVLLLDEGRVTRSLSMSDPNDQAALVQSYLGI